mmetsp:Transcript_150579/g.484194  ORF Transcript_150579/g.484194 Transcript_150579/m.484194 type:complete len:494 (+) Transcript_150579:135-1616(+)
MGFEHARLGDERRFPCSPRRQDKRKATWHRSRGETRIQDNYHRLYEHCLNMTTWTWSISLCSRRSHGKNHIGTTRRTRNAEAPPAGRCHSRDRCFRRPSLCGQCRRTLQELACETVWMPSPARGSLTFVELFAGIGGFRLGLEALGGRCVFGSEIAAECVTVYEANFGSEPPVAGDIYQVKDEDIPQHDVLLGGFPCQPFSWLGSQPGISDERGVLYKEIVRVLRAHRPSAFLLENVPGLLTCDGGRVITRIVSELESLGYSVSLEKVDSRCLTAQSRYRVFIVGIRQDGGVEGQAKKFRFPYIPDLALRVGDVLESDADLIAAGAVELHTLRQEQVLRWGSKEGLRNLAWHDTITHTLVSHYGGQLGRGSSQLVPRPPPHLPRRFTPRECARLMGFPESFDLGAPKPGDAPNEVNAWCRSRYSMLGNAVSPPLIAVLAGAILAQCPDVASERDWDATGRSVAIQLALQALPAQCREKILGRVHASFRQVVAE